MKLTIKKVRYKNFLSSGNVWFELELDKHTTTLITGLNGAGKSQFIDALVFALFGKSYRKVNKDQLVNNINRKNSVVELTFEYNGSEYVIKRGINPNIFEILQDGKPIEKQAASRDQQAWLENNIIRMSYETFCQIVILGSANYIPFMKLTVPQRREVIENIFPLGVFSRMNEILKDRISQNTSVQLNLNASISVNKTELDLQKQYKDKVLLLQSNQIDALQAEAKELSKTVKALGDEVVATETSLKEHQQRLDNLGPSKLTELEFEYFQVKGKLEEKQREIVRLSTEDICPTCGEKIDSFKRMKHLGEHKAEVTDLEKRKQLLDEQIWEERNLEPNRKDFNQKIQTLTGLIVAKKQEIKTLTQRGVRLLENIKEMKRNVSDITEIDNKIKQLTETITQKQAELAAKVNESIVQGHCSKLLKDNGLKAAVIKRYIKQLNAFVAKYLELLNYSVGFELNENFEETIKSRNKDLFTYQSFSMGQRARIDLSLLFAWRDIAKLRSGIECNLLIFDEVFDSSLDSNGAGDLMMILEHFSDKNVVIISHRSEHVVDKIDRHLVIKTNNGFSEVSNA